MDARFFGHLLLRANELQILDRACMRGPYTISRNPSLYSNHALQKWRERAFGCLISAKFADNKGVTEIL